MKHILLPALILLLALSLFGCVQNQPQALTVFAASSLNETLNLIGGLYSAETGVELIFNFDSSGALKTQIQEGAVCDVFISAAQKQMDQLDISASLGVNAEGLDMVLEGSRIDLLENKVTLAVPQGNPRGITSFDQLADSLRNGDVLLAMGNSDVPVGQYTQKILACYGLDEVSIANDGLITYGSNVKEVTAQVQEAAADCGVIYATDAFSARLEVVDTATAEMCGQVIYPAAVMKDSANVQAAKEFLQYLQGPKAADVFRQVGFTPIG